MPAVSGQHEKRMLTPVRMATAAASVVIPGSAAAWKLAVVTLACMAAWVLPLAQAAILLPMQPVDLQPGEHLQQPLSFVESEQQQNRAPVRRAQRIEIRLGRAPVAARLTLNDTGLLLVNWQSGPDLAAETVIEILVKDIDQGELLERQELLVRRMEPEPGPPQRAEPEPDDPAVPALSDEQSRGRSETQEQEEPPELPLPRLSPLVNQVVSAGRVVTQRVQASLPDGSAVIVQIDRLPANASFDANPDGSRSLYWQTSDRDQGEHLFRITAINPEDTRRRAHEEILIVVGDPTRSRTTPAWAVPTPSE